MENIRKNSGMILIATLLIIFILNLLAVSILNTAILETKINNYYYKKNQSMQIAENLLEQKERNLKIHKTITNIAEITRIAGADIYIIKATGKYANIETTLQSTFSPTIGRQSFLVIK